MEYSKVVFMPNLEERQREMRDRNARAKQQGPPTQPSDDHQLSGTPEVRALKDKIIGLEQRVHALEVENEQLRRQKTEIVERPTSTTLSDSEQKHLFLKYSNVRRY